MAFLTLARWALGPLVPVGTWRLKLFQQLGKSLAAYRKRLGLSVDAAATSAGIRWDAYMAMEEGTANLEQYDTLFWKAWENFDNLAAVEDDVF